MKSSRCLTLTYFVLILASLLLALETEHFVRNAPLVFNVQRGMSVNISCNYKKTDNTIIFHAIINTDHKLCSYMNKNKTWINQSCNRDIRLIWIAETEEISFELSNLQINNSGIYNCIVERHAPPPMVNLGNDQTFVQVFASPLVSMSCQEHDGFPMILCTSEGFYPSALEQVWLRDGELQNISRTHNTNRTNPDGSITLHSYLNLSSAMSDYLNYSCWVNHSSLNKPIVLHLSSADCYNNKPSLISSDNMKIALVISALLTLIILTVTVALKRFRRTDHRSPVGVRVTYESVPHSHLQSDIYSMLGDHRPIPCCNRPNRRLTTTTCTLNTD